MSNSSKSTGMYQALKSLTYFNKENYWTDTNSWSGYFDQRVPLNSATESKFDQWGFYRTTTLQTTSVPPSKPKVNTTSTQEGYYVGMRRMIREFDEEERQRATVRQKANRDETSL